MPSVAYHAMARGKSGGIKSLVMMTTNMTCTLTINNDYRL